KKLGHPVPELNFEVDAKSGSEQQMQAYTPSRLLSSRVPQNGCSVPLPRAILNCSGVSCACHSASLFTTRCDSTGPTSLPSALNTFTLMATSNSRIFHIRYGFEFD